MKQVEQWQGDGSVASYLPDGRTPYDGNNDDGKYQWSNKYYFTRILTPPFGLENTKFS